MDQKQIEDIVRSVMASMGQPQSQPQAPQRRLRPAMPPAPAKRWWKAARWTSGSAEAKAWIGVQHPHRAEVLTELKRSTAARVCTGRAGPRPRTQALLRFPGRSLALERHGAQRGAGSVGESAGAAGSAFRD